MIHSIIIGQGHITVTGQLDLMEDEARNILRFYEDGIKVLSYAIPAEREDELMPYEDSLDVRKLCKAVKNFIIDMHHIKQTQQCLTLIEYYDWYTNNIELIEGMTEECNDILKNDKGWRYYSDTNYL